MSHNYNIPPMPEYTPPFMPGQKQSNQGESDERSATQREPNRSEEPLPPPTQPERGQQTAGCIALEQCAQRLMELATGVDCFKVDHISHFDSSDVIVSKPYGVHINEGGELIEMQLFLRIQNEQKLMFGLCLYELPLETGEKYQNPIRIPNRNMFERTIHQLPKVLDILHQCGYHWYSTLPATQPEVDVEELAAKEWAKKTPTLPMDSLYLQGFKAAQSLLQQQGEGFGT
jgi:hypothetical protein